MLRARINNIDCILYYEERVAPEKAPAGYSYMYHVRHDEDDWTLPVTLEQSVLVNFFGTVFMKDPMYIGDAGYVEIESFSMESPLVRFELSGTVFEKVFCLNE